MRTAVGVAAVVALLAVPAVAFGLQQRDSTVNPQPGESTGPVTTPTTDPTSTPTSSSPTTVVTTPASAGAGELANAVLTVDWSWVARPQGAPADYPDPPCKSGPVQFAGGGYLYPQLYGQRISAVAHADVDHDGINEVLALHECQAGQAPHRQLVAYRTAGGGYQVLGTVARIDIGGGVDFTEFTVDSRGNVAVRFADRFACCGVPESSVVRHWRGFAWDGTHFIQVSGPTSF